MRHAPLVAAGSFCVLVSGVALHAAYWDVQQLATGHPLGFGYYNATAIQPGTGALFIAYSDGDRDDVLVRSWDGTSWHVQTVDAGRDVARGIDLAFNGAGSPAVSYAGEGLKFAERTDSAWTIKTIESKNATNDVTSLEFSGGAPAITYYVKPSGKNAGTVLKFARRAGSAWTLTTIAPGTRYSSLAFDAAGNPAIAFAGDANSDGLADALRLARLGPSGWTITTIEERSGAGTWTRLGFDSAGSPLVVDAHSGSGTIRFWYLNGAQWQQETIGTGYRPALIVHEGAPLVTYASLDGYGVMVARRDASGWTSELVATAPFGYVGQSSLAVPSSSAGQPAIAYCVDVFGIDASRTLWLAMPPVN